MDLGKTMSNEVLTDPALLALDASLITSTPPKAPVASPESASDSSPVPKSSHGSSKRTTAPKKRAHTTLSEKVMIINFIKNNPSWDQATVAKHFQKKGFPTLSQSTISRYIKDEERYRSLAMDPKKWSSKKQKQDQFPQVDSCMKFWYYQTLGKGEDPYLLQNLDVLRRKWKDFEALLAARQKKRTTLPSNWFENFKDKPKRFRYPLESRQSTPPSVASEIERIRQLTNHYDPEDILAMDEVGLAYSCPPSEPTSLFSQPKLTLVLTCSADGSWKDAPLLIGQASKSVAYPDQSTENLGFQYHWNNHAVMTFQIWEKYLNDLEEKCRRRDRKVLLLVDNTHIHLMADPEFPHIQIEFIESSRIPGCDPTEPYAHPFVAGITPYFKSEYRVRFCLRALSSDEFGLSDLYNIDQAAATKIIQDAWNCVSPDAISNAFQHSGVITPRSEDGVPQDTAFFDIPETVIVPDPLIEQSVASLTMCLTQLTIKVMNLSEQTDSDLMDENNGSEFDANINPALTGNNAFTNSNYLMDAKPKKPEDQIVSASEFIDIDASLPTELEWDDQDIVDQVLRDIQEAGEGTIAGCGSDLTSSLPEEDVSRIEAAFRSLKRKSSALASYSDGLDSGDKDEDGRKRRNSENASLESPSFKPNDANGEGAGGMGPDDQRERSKSVYENPEMADEPTSDSLSRFSCHISNLESLRLFCSELIEKNQMSDEMMSGRIRGSIIKDCLPVLSELEDEFKALEAADLLRHVSG